METVKYDVPLVAQPTDVTCWAASLAMVVGHREQASFPPDTIATECGMTTTDGYGWDTIRKAVQHWGLHEEGPVCTVAPEWAEMLKSYGPTWIVEIGNPYHAVVVTGIEGDGTPEGSIVTVNNPWPPNQGAVERRTYAAFESEFELGAGANAAIVHA